MQVGEAGFVHLIQIQQKKIQARPRTPAPCFKTRLIVVEDIFRQPWRKNALELLHSSSNFYFVEL